MIITDRRQEMPLIFRPVFKLSVLAVLTLLLIGVLLWIPGLLSSFLIAVILVFILSPAVDYFERHGIGRTNAILIVLLLILVLLVFMGMLTSNAIIGEYEDFASRIDFYSSMLNDEINRRIAELEGKFGLDRYEAGQRLLNLVQDKLKQALLFTGATFGTIITWVAVVPLMLFFFLLDGHRIKRTMIGFLPNRYFEMSLNIHQKINHIVGSFIRAKLIESAVVGICAMAGFIVVGFVFEPLNYALFLAILVGLFNIIPYLGPLIGVIPVLLVAIVQYVLLPQFPEFSSAAGSASSWAPVLAIIGVLIFAQIVDNVYLIPVLLGRSVNVHPLIVLLAVILGARMLGITGMIISIPLASIVQTMIFEVSEGIRSLRH
jgi:putative permease